MAAGAWKLGQNLAQSGKRHARLDPDKTGRKAVAAKCAVIGTQESLTR